MMSKPNGVTAHRGDSVHAPENTLPAFAKAFELGVDYVETDVRRTRDDVLVLCHDATTGRTGDRDLAIADHAFEELRTVNIGHAFDPGVFVPMPTLDELLALARRHSGACCSLQPKEPIVAAICAAVARSGLPAERVAFNDGTLDYLLDAHERLPASPIFYDLSRNDDFARDLAVAVRHGFAGLVARRDLMTETFAREAREAGLEPGVWTVNEPGEMERFFRMGVRRVYTDDPAAALAVLVKMADS